MKQCLLGVLFDPYGDILAGDGLNRRIRTLPPLGWVVLSIGVGIEAVDAETIWHIGEIVAKAVGPSARGSTGGVLHRADRIEGLVGATKKVVGVGARGIDIAGCRCLGGAGAG